MCENQILEFCAEKQNWKNSTFLKAPFDSQKDMKMEMHSKIEV